MMESVKPVVVALVLSVALFVAAVGATLYLSQGFATDLRDGLVKSCNRNGNPLREAVAKMIREQIKQSSSPEIRRYFPQIPAEELERLIRKQTKSREQTLREIAPVNCAALYPPP